MVDILSDHHVHGFDELRHKCNAETWYEDYVIQVIITGITYPFSQLIYPFIF